MAGNVTAIILLFLGGFLLFRGVPGIVELLKARSWGRVSGTVLGSGVAGYQTQATGGRLGANVRRAVVAYSYELDGRSYTGHRTAFGTPLGFGMGLGGIASVHASRYTPGERVDVWVDPTAPSNAVLRRSATSSLVITAAGLAAVVAGVLSFV